MVRQNNRHRRALEKIASHPDKFDINPDFISSSIEMNLMDGRRQVAQPDLVFEYKGREVLIVEYKGDGNGEMQERARKQLESAKWWYGKNHPEIPSEKITTRIISGDDPRYKGILR